LVGDDSRDGEPAVDRRDGRVVAEDLSLNGQHAFVDEPIAIVVPTIAHLVTRTHRALTHNAQSILSAHVFTLDALTHARPLAAALTELRPIFIHLVVAVVVDPVARLDTRPGLQLPTRPVHLAQRLGANDRAATAHGDPPRDDQDRRRARKGKTPSAARMCLQES
jgi:hypothetical protein